MSAIDQDAARNKHLASLYPEPTKSTYTSHQEPRPTLIGAVKPLTSREFFTIGFTISLALATIFTVFAFFIDIGAGAFLFFFCSGALAILVTAYFAKRALEKFYYKNNFVKMSFALFITFYIINMCCVIAIMHTLFSHMAILFGYILMPIVASLLSGVLFMALIHLSKNTISSMRLRMYMSLATLAILAVSLVVH